LINNWNFESSPVYLQDYFLNMIDMLKNTFLNSLKEMIEFVKLDLSHLEGAVKDELSKTEKKQETVKSNTIFTVKDNVIIANDKAVTVKFFALKDAVIPKKEYAGDSGMDVRLYNLSYVKTSFGGIIVDESKNTIHIAPGSIVLLPTGIYAAVPEGYEIQVRPKSGLSLKKGLSIVNSPGTIDSNYRGMIGVIVHNITPNMLDLTVGDKIAQLVVTKLPSINVVEVNSVEELENTDRGANGFGSTGK